jgi:PAS domain S-box-containing protein
MARVAGWYGNVLEPAMARMHEYTGLSLEVVRGWGWQNAIHPEDLKEITDKWLGWLASGQPSEVEGRLRRFDGVYRWFLFRAEPLRDESGNIVNWYGTDTDILWTTRDEITRIQILQIASARYETAIRTMHATGCLPGEQTHRP